MDTRCSYEDAAGQALGQVRGKVVAEGDRGALPLPVAGVRVTVHRVRAEEGGRLGPSVARTTTDAQGAFSLSAVLPPGEYAFVVEGSAYRTITLSGHGSRVVDHVVLVIPMDARLADERPRE